MSEYSFAHKRSEIHQFPIIFSVIPTFNRVAMLRECVESLIAQSESVIRIVIVNSGSTIEAEGMIKNFSMESANKIKLINVSEDVWWAECMNIGIEYSLSEGAEYVLAMNDDTHLDAEALKYLLQTSNKYKGSIVGGRVKDKKNSSQMINRGYGARYTKFRWLPYKKIIAKVEGREIYYTEGQSGRGVLFPASVYDKVGLYDIENFPHRGDRDFSYRCFKAGVGQYLDAGATVFLNFETSYQGLANQRLTTSGVLNSMFHINGLYNVRHQYNFLKKHYHYSWHFWFVIWFLFVIVICAIRMIPHGTGIIKGVFERKSYAPDS